MSFELKRALRRPFCCLPSYCLPSYLFAFFLIIPPYKGRRAIVIITILIYTLRIN
ncbi:elongation factor Tu [Enterobacteriaceae bacterium A-F18]|nr:elongation factor Tu [Enterobacteriaceae bacterium ENNIH3]AUV06688.1 elongation factor Tu [Enterobacteriaceae bacterium ENNIH2]PWF53352.1 elongation factor Tu [[Kluyvera] intestini]QIH66388.1 elongation factor Tu [Enterobacteriaceae bacterium A-F18]